LHRGGLDVRFLADDESGPRRPHRGRLRLALTDDLLEGRQRLVVLERGAVALHVTVAERMELLDELGVRELDPMLLELLPELVYPLLRHWRHL
jgi:hypothetical protein